MTNQIVTQIRDVEVSGLLERTPQFRDCREMHAFDASDTPQARDQKIKAAQICFRDKINQGNNSEEDLKKLSEALELQSYGLVKGRTAREIQEYLNNKMYQSMTGVDPKDAENNPERYIQSLKNKKHIDQATFISIYKNQITKNSLFEVSRFCFEKFRRNNGSGSNFASHWSNFNPSDKNISNYNDKGSPAFGTLPNGTDDKQAVYQAMFNNIGSQSFTQWKDFFELCRQMIKPLCDAYKNSLNVRPEDAQSLVRDAQTSGASASPQTNGASACLTMGRLQEQRNALDKARKVQEHFATMTDPQEKAELLNKIFNGEAKIFGNNPGDETLDNLTNYTSTDLLEGGLQQSSQEQLNRCTTNPELPACESLAGNEEDFLKAQYRVETEMSLKRQIEMERVRKLKAANDSSLEDYLKENGFFAILEEYKNGTLTTDAQIAERVGQEFEARKAATLQEIQNKLGRRQARDNDQNATQQAIRTTAEESAQERARLAQVVLFNNIITSQLDLTRIENGQEVSAGRNVNAWKKEEAALRDSQIDESLFSNLQIQDDGNTRGVGQNEQLGGLNFIEEILGKKKDNTAGSTN